ncbi:MAG: LPXTG cell wall anchor domain-containing protein, partial [Brevibacterium yomogidense]
PESPDGTPDATEVPDETTAPGTPDATEAPPQTETPVPPHDAPRDTAEDEPVPTSLPRTGADSVMALGLAITLIAVGVAALTFTRRG